MPTSEQEAHALIQAIDELLDATGLGRVELILRKIGPGRYLARFALELPNRGGSITYTPPEATAAPSWMPTTSTRTGAPSPRATHSAS